MTVRYFRTGSVHANTSDDFSGGTLTEPQNAALAKRQGPNYFNPPHGNRPPASEVVRRQTQKYLDAERKKRH